MDARRQHRIIYQTKIRMRAPGRDDSVIARVQNLSANGMFVTASDLPDAGTEVQCRLTLGGERRTLRGRVAWVRPASPATPLKSPGAGIEFLELDQRDSELLNRLVDPTDERREPVDVWFEGMTTPIRCQAVVVGDGLRLETRLPFMRVNSEVRVAFSQQVPPEVREGVLHGVTLEPSPEDGVPFLRIGVTVPPLDSARGTIEIAAGEALRPEDQKTPLASTVVDPTVTVGAAPRVAFGADRDRTHKISLSESTSPAAPTMTAEGPNLAALPAPSTGSGARTLFTGLVLGAALAVAAMWAWTHRAQPSPPTVALAVAESSAPVKDPAAGAAIDPGVADPALPAATAPTAAAPATADPAAAEVPGPEIVPLLAGEDAGGAAAGAALQPDGMALETSDGRVTFTVALEGKAAGAKEIRYGDPAGVGVTLPRARPKGGFGTFTPGAGPVRVMIRRRGSGSLVRFFYDGRAFQGKLAVEAEMLRLVLAPR
jgi:Tfp pilus assembly protein PilZ